MQNMKCHKNPIPTYNVTTLYILYSYMITILNLLAVGKWRDLPFSIICFKNGRYHSRRELSNISLPTLPPGIEERYFPGRVLQEFTNTKCLKIRLTRTADSSPPGLNLLEVWGQPGRSCPLLGFHQFLNHFIPKKETEKPKHKASTSSIPKVTVDEIFQVPEEFYDAITCEIMAKPVLLPSGYTVDELTLDKYTKEEAVWGRLPNDPFTCITFKNTSKAVHNSSLKARIDQFLIKNGDKIDAIPRTLGRSETASKVRHLPSILANPKPRDLLSSEPVKEQKQERKIKRQKTSDGIPVTQSGRSTNATSKSLSSHETIVSQSLDSALQATLSSLKTFTKPKYMLSSQTDTTKKVACSSCLLTTRDIFYQLPCLHVICQICLVTKKGKNLLSCDSCENSFTSADPVRIHS